MYIKAIGGLKNSCEIEQELFCYVDFISTKISMVLGVTQNDVCMKLCLKTLQQVS